MKKLVLIGVLLLTTAIVMKGGRFYWHNLRGIGPATSKPSQDISKLLEPGQNQTNFPLKIPPGFSLSVLARGLDKPRVLVLDTHGNRIVSIPSQGRVVALKNIVTVVENLNEPHGLAFRNEKLYIAETDQVSVYDYDQKTFKAKNKLKILDLPNEGGHSTRTLLIKDNQLFVSIGSSCNICKESDNRRAAILTADLNGNNVRNYATGLRNAVFMKEHPKTGEVWVTEMGRDLLGDDIPPDEINIVKVGKDYGWPYCYGKQITDPFNKNQKDCQQTEPSYIDLQAHSAPLGLAFIPDNWPEEYRDDMLVSFHGSWNRSIPTGYKIVRIKLDSGGKYEGTEDFITGWLQGNQVLGRPVDLLFDNQGNLFISDDKAGVIYLLKPPAVQ